MTQIAILDMGLRSRDPWNFAKAFGQAIEETGFVKLVGHPVDLNLIARARVATTELFTFEDTVLQLWETPENGRRTGFTSTGVERARDVPPERADLKRFWQIRSPDQGFPCDFPDELVSGFGPSMLALYAALEELALDLLEDLDLYLGHDELHLRGMATGGDTLLRIIDYPKVGNLGRNGAVRSGAHQDINFMTVMVPATTPGLQIQDHDDTWYDAAEEPDQIIVDGGDMLQLYTGGNLDENWKVHGGRLRATTHRVVNPQNATSNTGRNSFPLFVHPKGTDILHAATGVRANHYLFQRLVEIGLMDPSVRDDFYRTHPLLAVA